MTLAKSAVKTTAKDFCFESAEHHIHPWEGEVRQPIYVPHTTLKEHVPKTCWGILQWGND